MSDKKEKKEMKALENELEKVSSQLQEFQSDKEELVEKLQRVSADYANFQKRSVRQVSEAISYEKEKIVKTLLPAMDNFEHTLSHGESAKDVEAVLKGVRIIYDQMLGILQAHGVEPIESLGESFDPSIHQAMLQKYEEDKEDGVVLEEFQRGYKLGDRVIRPAKVVVNKYPENEFETQESEGETDGEQFEDEQ